MKVLSIILLLLSLLACQSQTDEKQNKTAKVDAPTQVESGQETPQEPQENSAKKPPTPPSPPSPPIFENFQARPQLSFFPRAGAFRPANDDKEGLQYWRTYIEHLMRTSGPIKPEPDGDNIAFGFRAIKGLESVGVFSPLAVKPNTTYEVSVVISCDLTEDASAGIGLLEFKEFLWIGEQFSEEMAKEHQIGAQKGITLSGKIENQAKNFTFTTGPQTEMIHLIFFRDGAQDRNPVLIDDIAIDEVGAGR